MLLMLLFRLPLILLMLTGLLFYGIDVANAGIVIDGVVHATNGSVGVDVVFATFDVNVAALDMLAGLL